MTRNNITGDRIATKPASEAYRDGHDRIDWPSRRKPKATDEQCGDCNGTGRIDGRPCPACAPTDDGPGDGGNE